MCVAYQTAAAISASARTSARREFGLKFDIHGSYRPKHYGDEQTKRVVRMNGLKPGVILVSNLKRGAGKTTIAVHSSPVGHERKVPTELGFQGSLSSMTRSGILD